MHILTNRLCRPVDSSLRGVWICVELHPPSAAAETVRARIAENLRFHVRHDGCSSVGIPASETMEPHSLTVNQGFDRLQRLLLGMRAGDELKPGDAADATGLTPEICRAVLVRLERAGLMTHQSEDLFVRRSLDVMET